MHAPHLSKDLVGIHVWRQTITQANIDNFYQEDMNILNPRLNTKNNNSYIYRLEFPIMQWTIAAIYQITGNKILVTRITILLISLFTTLGFYNLLIEIFSNKFLAFIGVWCLTFSPCFFYYSINPLPDVLALSCSIWGLFLFYKWSNYKNSLTLFLSGAILTLATLVKLPYIIFFSVPLVFITRSYLFNDLKKIIRFGFIVFSLTPLPIIWYSIVMQGWGEGKVIKGILSNDTTIYELLSYINHFLTSSIPEFFLNYASIPLFIAGFYFFFKRKGLKNRFYPSLFSLSLVILLYFIFELNVIKTVHDYYLFPVIPLLFIVVSYGGYHLLQSKKRWVKTFTVICLITLPLTCYLRTKNSWNTENPGFNADLYRFRNELRLLIPKDELVVAGNDFTTSIFLYYIKRKGWTFDKDQLYNDNLENYINQGAKYLYTDSEAVIKTNSNLIKQKIGQFGSIQVFELQANQ